MKIFSWMQSKLNGKQSTTRPTGGGSTTNHNAYEPRKDEFSDWPHGLLAIGTFGNKTNTENEDSNKNIDSPEQNPSSSPIDDQLDFTPEEVGKLQKELTKLLSRKPADQTESQRRKGINLPLDKFLNCPSSLEVDRTICNKITDDDSEENREEDASDFRRSLSMVLGRAKDLCVDGAGGNNMIKKKSISFLLKKMFVCSSGFAPTPNIRDQIPESRMEKLLRAILHKKIRPRPTSSSPAPSKKFIDYKHSSNEDIMEDHTDEKEDLKCKWVKTDSEYIVLEI